MNLYCKLVNGDLVPKRTVDNAVELFERLKNGFTIVELTDEELFAKGNYVDAVKRFHDKHNVGLAEAKAAIDFLREEGR